MALVKTPAEIEAIAALARTVSGLLAYSLPLVAPGVTTAWLDERIEARIDELGVRGPCKGYHGYPAVSCLSVNDQVTHGIPDGTVLKEGDIIDIDLVIEKDGFFADVSRTVPVGRISPGAGRLIHVAEECLVRAINAVRPGGCLGDIGHAVQEHAERNGYSVVRDYCGHFIGRAMHEEPSVTNIGRKGKGLKLQPGMIFCIEPMINEGSYEVITRGWDARTADGKLSSRCEHMVLVTARGVTILTDW